MMQKMLVIVIKGYRLLLSPWLGSVCRFTPTCSLYALQALDAHGAGRGSYLTLRRLARCHPWCAGGHDPIPMLFPHPVDKENLSNPKPSIADPP